MKYAIIGLIVAVILGLGGYFVWQKSHEHPGTALAEHPGEKASDEHPGKKANTQSDEKEKDEEHPGEKKESEHPGENTNEHPGDSKLEIKKDFTATEIKTAIRQYISSRTDSKSLSGIFEIFDAKENKNLKLRFVKIHDPVRKLNNKEYFACTDFEVVGTPGRLYDLDFWLSPESGKLVTTEEKIHKHPADNEGRKIARYTFKDEEIVDIK
ncbi:MAG: hypothetical protein HYW47_05545 [Deltaproteobacteria bacterium]|nr:hypothetical protein [Deltaproteobacteria bacterium]